jgi:hypothetical protein
LKVHRLNDGAFPTDKSHYLAAVSSSFTLASPSLHTSLPQVLCMSSRVGNTGICGSMVYVELITMHTYIGEIHIVDNASPDKTTKLVAGDVIHFEEVTSNITTTPSKGKGK